MAPKIKPTLLGITPLKKDALVLRWQSGRDASRGEESRRADRGVGLRQWDPLDSSSPA
jgi:hypothetical protein